MTCIARTFGSLLPALLVLGACTRPAATGNDATLYGTDNAVALSPGMRAVRIGEGGAAIPACPTEGVTGPAAVPLRAAPFDEAAQVASLSAGTRVALCGRSLDQRWQGVVVPPEATPDADCGVSDTIDTPRDYAGPCRSGWILASTLRPAGT